MAIIQFNVFSTEKTNKNNTNNSFPIDIVGKELYNIYTTIHSN